MKQESNSLRAVLFALGGNFAIAVIKFIVSLISGSSAMLAEAIHSVADTTNQVFLLIGRRRSAREANELHAFGYGKEEYYWGFLVAVLLFFVGGCFSLYEGIHKVTNPEPLEKYIYIFVVLGLSIIIELKSFTVALTEFRKASTGPILKAIRESTDTNIFVILVEDFAALAGLTIVLISTLLSLVNPLFDAIGTLFVGALLVLMSFFLANELRKLIIGENISREMRNGIKAILHSHSDIRHINNIRSMYIGNNKFMLLISLDVEDRLDASAVECLTSQIKTEITGIYPNARYIYIEVEE
ncbi:MAG: cation diffusion facilitator family transporter [Bacteroidales bacterium]|nr:cation diffusion facilitator family transporter [Bacteroidales bacterium]